MNKRVEMNLEERITLQTMIAMEIKRNKEHEKFGIEPCFNTEVLKGMYKKIAGCEYKEMEVR